MSTIKKETVASKNMRHRFVVYALFTCAYFDVTSDNNFSRKQKKKVHEDRIFVRQNTTPFISQENQQI